MYKIAICTNDKKYIKYLEGIIEESETAREEDFSMCVFHSGEQFLLCQTWDFDLIFIEIKMNGMDGLETAMKLRKMDDGFVLVFSSDTTTLDLRCFKANPFRCLMKGGSKETALAEMAEILSEMRLQRKKPYILCKSSIGKEKIKIYSDAILYIAIRREYCDIFICGELKERHKNELFRTSVNLDSVSKILNESRGFVRIHYSYIVNMAHIVFINSRCVKLVDGTQLNISRSRSKGFQEAFAKFLATKCEGWK